LFRSRLDDPHEREFQFIEVTFTKDQSLSI